MWAAAINAKRKRIFAREFAQRLFGRYESRNGDGSEPRRLGHRLTLELRRANAVDSASAGALAAARVYTVQLASYDYRHLDQDFNTVKQNSSTSFRASFTQSSGALASILAKYKATASAKVVAAGVVSASSSRVVVLAFLQQTVTNSTQKSGPQTDQSRVQMTLVHAHGRWLIDQVQLL